LAEHHGDELGPAGEAFDVSLGAMLANQRGEVGAGEVVKDLTKETGDVYHDFVLLLLWRMDFRQTHYAIAKEDVFNQKLFWTRVSWSL